MGDPFIDVCKGVSNPWGFIGVIPLVTIGSKRDGNWRWFPNSLGHPWANSERQVAQEKFLEDSISNQLTNCLRNLSILPYRMPK